jgi:hypothetical protein
VIRVLYISHVCSQFPTHGLISTTGLSVRSLSRPPLIVQLSSTRKYNYPPNNIICFFGIYSSSDYPPTQKKPPSFSRCFCINLPVLGPESLMTICVLLMAYLMNITICCIFFPVSARPFQFDCDFDVVAKLYFGRSSSFKCVGPF